MNEDSFAYNLSVLVKWTPYASEAELLKQVRLVPELAFQ